MQIRDRIKNDAGAKKAEADVKAFLKKVAAANKKKK